MNRIQTLPLFLTVVVLSALLTGTTRPWTVSGRFSAPAGPALPSPLLAGDQWRPAEPGYQFSFPSDHASHEPYRLEWWYYTGNVRTASGREFGFQLTFFRTGIVYRPANPSRWSIRDLYPAHFAITDVDNRRFHYFERLNRGGIGWAGADLNQYRVWNEGWEASLDGDVHVLTAKAGDFGIGLKLRPEKPEVVHDQNGVSQKADLKGYASHYYSLSRLDASGTVEVEGQPYEVSGLAWMDHEFGSRFLEPDEVGWDWFSIQLDDGSDIMLLQIRRSDGSIDPHSAGTLVAPDGKLTHLEFGKFSLSARDRWQSATSGATYPVGWHVEVPGADLALDVRPAIPDQELRTTESTGIVYWEGGIRVTGLAAGRQARGSGYLEMTGYAGQVLPDELH